MLDAAAGARGSTNPPGPPLHLKVVLTAAVLLALQAGPAWVPAGRDTVCDARWYTRAVPDQPVNELKATGVLDAPLDDVFEVLLDFDGYRHTMPSTSASRVLVRDAPDGAVVYLRYDLGVIAARDSVVHMRWGLDGATKWLRWRAARDRDALAPVTDGVVRLPLNEGSWVLEPRGPKTFVTYQLLSAPGGALPAFLVNAINGAGVPQTLEALERAAKRRATAR